MTGSFEFPGSGSRRSRRERAKELKLKEERGVEVRSVEEESPAAKAGVKIGDVVLEYQGQRVEGAEQFVRLPGFLMVLGPDGPLGQATQVTIEETPDPAQDRPRRIVVRGSGQSIEVTLAIEVESAIRTPMTGGPIVNGLEFLQLRGRYQVSGEVGNRVLAFSAPGAAETFRGR